MNNSSKTVSKNCVGAPKIFYKTLSLFCYNFSLVSKTSPCRCVDRGGGGGGGGGARAAQEDGLELENKKQYPDAEDRSVCPIAHFNRAVLRL
jgi:hypothetical protein